MKKSIFSFNNSGSMPEIKNPKVKLAGQTNGAQFPDSKPGNRVGFSDEDEIEVTHEVYFGENIKRVLRAFFRK